MARTKSTPSASATPAAAAAKVDAAAVQQPAAAVPEIEEAVASTPPPAVPEDASDKLAGVIGVLATLTTKIKDLATELRDAISATKSVQKDVLHLQKAAAKRSRRTVNEGSSDGAAPRRPSGFAKPSLLSNELCEFLGMEKGSLIARTDVTRAITKYVKENNLFDQNDKRRIIPDGKLSALLGGSKPGPDGAAPNVTYFNLQSHIKQHFIKEAPAAAVQTA